MRALQVCQPAEGGVARQVLVLSEQLMARGWSVDVACSPGALADELRRTGANVWLLPLVREASPWKDLIATLKLSRIIKRRRYSLVHAHSAKAGAVGRVAACIARTPVIYTPHAWSFLASKSTLGRQVYIFVEQALALLSSHIICVSAREMALGCRHLLACDGKLRLVPNGIALPSQSANGRSGDEELVVGTVARLAPQKGIEYLIRAAEGICAERDGVRFSVAGDGPSFMCLKGELERRELRDKFTLLGDTRDPWNYLKDIDVFVLPSLWEGMPFALMEAMGMGLPAVATDVGGVRDLIPDVDFGTVVPPADPHALREAILRYVDSPQLRKTTGALARQRILQEFNLERMIEGTLNVYSETLEGGFRAIPHALS